MRASVLVVVVSQIARAAVPVTTPANFPGSMVYAVQTDAAGNINMWPACMEILQRPTRSLPN
jgi:hypothetical protein